VLEHGRLRADPVAEHGALGERPREHARELLGAALEAGARRRRRPKETGGSFGRAAA
jgi:hypothetical protein